MWGNNKLLKVLCYRPVKEKIKSFLMQYEVNLLDEELDIIIKDYEEGFEPTSNGDADIGFRTKSQQNIWLSHIKIKDYISIDEKDDYTAKDLSGAIKQNRTALLSKFENNNGDDDDPIMVKPNNKSTKTSESEIRYYQQMYFSL